VLEVYERWASGLEVSETDIVEASKLLGTPSRKVEVFLDRFRAVFGRIVEERCTETSRGRVCIYSWSRRAYKRYFPVALDAAGTVVWFPEPGRTVLVSYPLHRAFDLGVHGVELPQGDPVAVTPRLDGWQVNLYYDPLLGRWMFSTRFVLHNMRFEAGRLVVEEYGTVANPLVETAERIASRVGLVARLEPLRGWTFTFMVVGEEPATALRRLPEPDEADRYNLVLVAARRPDGGLLPPYEPELAKLAERLGVASLAEKAARMARAEALEQASSSVETPSLFLWYGGDPEHPAYYEAKSQFYEDYVNAVARMDARSLVVLATGAPSTVLDKLREELGEVVDQVVEALKTLEDAVRKAYEESKLDRALRELPIPERYRREAARASAKAHLQRVVRIIAVSAVEGLGVGEAAEVIRSFASRLREQ
jgi:hypothetical protein